MAENDFRIRSERGELRLLLVHHPQRRGNLDGRHGKHNDDDERLTIHGQLSAVSLGILLGQYAVVLRTSRRHMPSWSRYLFDIASATQGRVQEANVRTRRAAYDVMRSMGELGLAHSIVVPNWNGIWMGKNLAGLTETEIADRRPQFAREWMLWREGQCAVPPRLPEPDSETAENFAARVVYGLRFASYFSQTELLAAYVHRSVLQLARSVLQGYNPLENLPYADPPYGYAEEWALYPDRPPESMTNGFVSPVRLAAIYAERYGWRSGLERSA